MAKSNKVSLTVRVPKEMAERLRNLVYWTPEHSIASFVTEALSAQLGQYERERGSVFPERKIKKDS